ncbi:MAG TPA: S8 family peptidase [Nitriliruptorales bacterium]|nr:S8 family peptidase [Nitriliruptorales bacterium]
MTTLTVPHTRFLRLRALLAVVTVALVAGAVPATSDPFGSLTAAEVASAEVVVAADVEAALAAHGEVRAVVQVHPGSIASARAAVTDAGGEVLLDLSIIDGFSARLTPAALARLRALGPAVVRAITLDGPVRFSHTTPAGQYVSDSSFVETIGADHLHRAGIDGSGVGIAIIDTGVSSVADLQGRLRGGVDLTVERDGVDRFGHGTFVAGVAAGSGVSSAGDHAGVAPGAHVVPVKIAGANGASDVSHVLAALQWVVSFRHEFDVEVLNLSFGTDSSQSYLIDPMNYAVEKAWDAGLVVVVAAANDGPDPRTVMKPADDPLVITVGATDSNGTVGRHDDIVAGFSSRGPTRADELNKPDLVAPGAHIIGLRSPGSTIDAEHPYARVGQDYFRGSGTSFSAAVTSGAVALLKQLHPEWTPDQVKGALFGLAVPGPVGERNVDGLGALDVRWAQGFANPGLNQSGKARSNGSGSLGASRGSLLLRLEKDPQAGLTALLSGEMTAQDQIFNGLLYTTTEWTKNSWYDSDWYKNSWYKNSWYKNSWYKNSWYGDEWQ